MLGAEVSDQSPGAHVHAVESGAFFLLSTRTLRIQWDALGEEAYVSAQALWVEFGE